MDKWVGKRDDEGNKIGTWAHIKDGEVGLKIFFNENKECNGVLLYSTNDIKYLNNSQREIHIEVTNE